MASLTTVRRNGKVNYRIGFDDKAKQRHDIYLGRKYRKKDAQTIQARVSSILGSKLSDRALDADTARWLGSIGDDLHQKLAKVGLVSPRIKQVSRSLAEVVDEYIGFRTDLANSTIELCKSARSRLAKFFGTSKPIRDITEGDCLRFRQQLVSTLAESTVGTRVKHTKWFFEYALKCGYIDKNPCVDLKGGNQVNRDNQEHIARQRVQQVIDCAKTAEDRLMIALCRYGGLRTPSEPLQLRWDKIDWPNGRFSVYAPKTKKWRTIPLFKELRPFLEDVFAPEAVYVLQDRRRTATYRNRLKRAIQLAGVQPWERPWRNLRSSCENDLIDMGFPAHAVAAWMGHSTKTAEKHYLEATDKQFELAAAGMSFQDAHHHAHLNTSASDGNETQPTPSASPLVQGLPAFTRGCDESPASIQVPTGHVNSEQDLM